MNTIEATRLTPAITHHGEGPVWLGERGLGVLDMLAGDIVLLDENGATTDRITLGTVVAAVRPRRAGGYVAGLERGFALFDADFAKTAEIPCWSGNTVRMNDGACDPQGRFWCGSMAYDLAPGAGALWRLETDGTKQEVLGGIGCSNGLGWTQDGTRAYYVDSLTHGLDVLTATPDGAITDRTQVESLAQDGFPDGIAVDRAGGVWLALFGAGKLIHIDADGRRDAEITLPVAQVTACAFGGPGFDRLYITTSRYALNNPEPEAGAVFVAEPPVGGFAPFPFAG
ncbi:SMP-30/gluconolactonase/LRE family protein [Streptomyces sp. NPDC057565]|uniref:SMP-30/gluconolactonase/LRE family protein n=1 Tax=Streptomyces sp. NPDC057565 TaxID=3346169 RepID=UPI0036B9AACE